MAVRGVGGGINPASICLLVAIFFAPERGTFFIYALRALLVGALARLKARRCFF
jgi:hypothetical protein